MNILCLSPHTDDIELACGGSLTKWKEEGHNLFIAVFSACEESLLEGWDEGSTIKELLINTKRLNAEPIIYNYPVRRFNEHRQNILEDIVRLKEFKPDLVIIPSQGDLHQDHKVISDEGMRAFKCNVLAYEPYNGKQFNPNFFVPLTRRQVTKKIGLIHTYKSQEAKGRKYFSDEFTYGLAKIRGANANVEYAESYEVIKWLY